MATIALSAAGMAIGGSIGGSVLGLSAATIGRAAGAAIGRRIDQQILGGGSESVEVGRIDRFRVTGAAEGAAIARIYGRMRVPGQVIWASDFLEHSTTSGGGSGKGGGRSEPTTTTYSYSVSVAIALCEGQIGRIGRVWADGAEIAPDSLNMRVYTGTQDQSPDPKIAAVEGAANAPAYPGIAYVVCEEMPLAAYGNRIPQLTFEVIRPRTNVGQNLSDLITGVRLLPGTGEYALATTKVHQIEGYGVQRTLNVNTPLGPSDFAVSMDALQGDLPRCRSVLVPVAWFGDDLRANHCTVKPMVTQSSAEVAAMPWRVSGVTRGTADVLPQVDDAPLFDGTPNDAAVVEAIADLRGRGLSPVIAPTLLMTQTAGNTAPDPWSGATGQPVTPWRGLITAELAPGQEGSPDGTAAVTAQIASFMGTASPAQFSVTGAQVSYTGSGQGYRRFILHYAHLCAAAGGVDAFCIGSQLRGLTHLRDDQGGFPMVSALRDLAAEVRGILGSGCKIGYAADWTEYHGMTPVGTSDKIFHLDALWADANIDFVGIENGMPLSDWRDGTDHADASHRTVADMGYLAGNVTGGEGYDWHYPTPEARAAQRRVAIADADGEDWVWRPKDLAGWWGHVHYDRIGGVKSVSPTAWVPKSKPIWFTSLGCAAVQDGANQPDALEKAPGRTPRYSDGSRDDLMQQHYLLAMLGHYSDADNNPMSDVYAGQMLDLARVHVQGWDARPYPFWPGNRETWHDGADYATGPWLNGRVSSCTLASVVAEICDAAGVDHYDVSRLNGVVRGYTIAELGTARAALQPLMLAYGFDVIEREGQLIFRNRADIVDHTLDADALARDPDTDAAMALTRAPKAEIAGRVQLAHIDADADYAAIAAEVRMPDDTDITLTRDELPLVMTRAEGQATVARWLQEARAARETARFALPPSTADLGVGDIVQIDAGTYRIDRIEEAGARLADATRIWQDMKTPEPASDDTPSLRPHVSPTPAEVLFLDLPLLTGDEEPYAPYVAATGRPWTGNIAVYGAPQDSDYTLMATVSAAATLGVTQNILHKGPVGIWDRQAGVDVTLVTGTFSSAMPDALLAGANTIAIGDGSVENWEILQFATATPVAERTYRLSGLLRGQFGTRGKIADPWLSGSRVVLLNNAPQSINLPSATRGSTRHFRYGPAGLALNDPTFQYAAHAFQGNGLRPYPVAHLRAQTTGGEVAVNWIRSTRIDGDIWGQLDVPLGEESEAYFLQVTQNGVTRRATVLGAPSWVYSAAEQAIDLQPGPYRIEVAQLSERYGAGPYMGVDIA